MTVPRQLSVHRVHEVLAALGWDPGAFDQAYDALEVPVLTAEPERSSEETPPARPRPGSPPPYNTAQAAKRLRVNEKTVRRYVERGWLQAYVTQHESPQARRYRFDDAQLDAFRRSHWRQAEAASGAEGEA